MRLSLADIEINGKTYKAEHAKVETYRLEREDHGMLTAVRGRHGVCQSNRGFSYTCTSNEESARAAVQTPAQKSVKLPAATGRRLAMERFVVLCGDEARVDGKTTVLDGEVMEPATKGDAPHLRHSQPSAFGTIVQRELLQQDHAMGDGVQLQVIGMRGKVVEEQDSAFAASEKVL